MAGVIPAYLDLLDRQRGEIFERLGRVPEPALWYRPGRGVWSIGEHLDHTRVLNRFARRLMIAYYPPASLLARLFRGRPFEAEIDDVYKRPGFPMNVGWIWPPRSTPERPASLAALEAAIRAEHEAYRRFYTTRDERLLGHVVLPDPVIGALNLVQWLRVQGYHDAHHFERVRVRIDDPAYLTRATAGGSAPDRDGP